MEVRQYVERTQDGLVFGLWVMLMKDSIFLWVGPSEPQFRDLSMALQTKYDKFPTGEELMTGSQSSPSKTLAEQLSRRSGQVVYMSYNLPPSEDIQSSVVQVLMERLAAAHPAFAPKSTHQ